MIHTQSISAPPAVIQSAGARLPASYEAAKQALAQCEVADNGIPARQMADLIGDVSESGVRKWMYGERVPRADQLRRISEVTDGKVQPNDFILSSDEQENAA